MTCPQCHAQLVKSQSVREGVVTIRQVCQWCGHEEPKVTMTFAQLMGED
jgi:transcription elongation factor Elf1